MAGQSDREREIFNSALERATLAERAAYLDGACGEDVEMRSRLAALLGAHDMAGGFLPMDNPQPDVVTRTQGDAARRLIQVEEQPGSKIGPYKLRQKVGEGGCGVVYVAEQEQPVRRRGTIGQHDAGGPMQGGNYSLTGGFWSLIAIPTPGLPSLTIWHSANTVTISWPNTGSYILLQNSNLATGTWTSNTAPVSTLNGSNSVTISPPIGNLFFRLKQ